MLEALNCDEMIDELFGRHDEEEVKARHIKTGTFTPRKWLAELLATGGLKYPFYNSYPVRHDVTLQLTLPNLDLLTRTPRHL